MELAKIILEYLKVVLWPTFAFVVAFIYRKQVSDIIFRLKKAGLPGGVSIDLSAAVVEVQELSSAAGKMPNKKTEGRPAIPLTEANTRMIQLGLRPSSSGLDMEYYKKIALQDPNLALAGLRMEIDILALNLAKGSGIDAGKNFGIRLLRLLLDEKIISWEQFDLTRKITELCNAAVHGTPVPIEQAESVIDSAHVLTRQYLEWLSWGFKDGWKPSTKDSTS